MENNKNNYIDAMNHLQVSDELHLSLLALEKSRPAVKKKTFPLKYAATTAAAVCLIAVAAVVVQRLPITKYAADSNERSGSPASSESSQTKEDTDAGAGSHDTTEGGRVTGGSTSGSNSLGSADNTNDSMSGNASQEIFGEGSSQDNQSVESSKPAEEPELQTPLENDKTIDSNEIITPLSLDEFAAHPLYKDYIPSDIPGGFQFESSYMSVNETSGRSYGSLMYTKNYHNIGIFANPKDDAVPVDITNTLLYDITPYEIPFAETIPKEYADTILNPNFAIEDFSKEALALRAYDPNEAGDSGIRMEFTILDGDMAIRYSLKGLTVDEAYDLVLSSPYFQ